MSKDHASFGGDSLTLGRRDLESADRFLADYPAESPCQPNANFELEMMKVE